MTRLTIKIFDLFRRHRTLAWTIFVTATLLLVASTSTLRYSENIRDFLPFDDDEATAMEVYQDITGAGRIYAVISGSDAVTDAVDNLTAEIAARDTTQLLSAVTATVDDDMADSITSALYRLMPMLLTDADYNRIDSLLSQPDLIDTRLAADAASLRFPVSGMAADNLRHDPLGLLTPVMLRLRDAIPDNSAFDTSDGYILSPDGTEAFIMMESSSGANESGHNSLLVDMLDDAAAAVTTDRPDIDITFTGAPVIAVENARCIRHDSLYSILAAGIVIMVLLIYVFRSTRNIALIFVSVAWGWLFAMGAIALWYDSVSIIVVGIASVMLGIAVNYPLHLVDHLSECHDRRRALTQIVAPLVVGNITTVGAFLCLVPLDSPALHDLGLFSSMLLVGTILFVLIFLPHAVKTGTRSHAGGIIGRLASITVTRPGRLVWIILLLTAIFAIFSTRTTFDSDLRNINYLTDSNRALLDRMSSLTGTAAEGKIYVVSNGPTWDDALESYAAARPESVRPFLATRNEQLHRLDRWSALSSRRDSLVPLIDASARANGFSTGAFDSFATMLSRDYTPAGYDDIRPLLFAGNVSVAPGRYSIVETVSLPDSVDRQAALDSLRNEAPRGTIVFDVTSMHEAITGTLAGDFNYIGLACGCIVFLFLWMSMGRIELAAASFLPMAVSWIWILGIMGMLDMHFNIVNIILATFIFGQGDDYTIFITEGLSYELAYRRRIVSSYKTGIVVSALIMFAGIGVLAFAGHPAMRSLGQVAVIGMIVVVAMAYILPPLVFGFLTRCHGRLRLRPVTLTSIFCNMLSLFTRRSLPGIRVDIAIDGPVSSSGTPEESPLAAKLRRRYRLPVGVRFVGLNLLAGPGERLYSPGRVTAVAAPDPHIYNELCRRYLTVDDVCRLVADRYLYKGVDIRRNALRALRDIAARGTDFYLREPGSAIAVTDHGQGELTLVYALLNPHAIIRATLPDDDALALMRSAADGVASNIFGSVFVMTKSSEH